MVAPGAKKPSSSRFDAELHARHEALKLVEEKFRDFDVVWAKVHGFPWWPGVLFHSWDVVRRAGIRTDPKIVAELVVPPPEKVAEVDTVTGQETGAMRLRRHCLVMFLDKFNFSVVEIDPSNVASFTAHYQLHERAVMGTKNKKKTEFRRALVKATELLHLGNKFEDDDLVMLEEPSSAEKKQRMEEVMGVVDVEDGSGSLDDAWDDPENKEDAAFSIEELSIETAEEKKPMRKVQKTKKEKDAKKIKDEDEDFLILTPIKHRWKAPAKDLKSRARKASRKESQNAAHVISRSPSPIDLTKSPKKKLYSDRSYGSGKPPKFRKKKTGEVAAGKSTTVVRDRILIVGGDDDVHMSSEQNEPTGDNKVVADEVTDMTTGQKDTKPSDLVLTPLSSIWTTTILGEQSAAVGTKTHLAYKQDFVWDDAVFTDELSIAEKEKAEIERKQVEDAAAHAGLGRERSLGKRQSRSVQQSQIRQNLMTGNLDPHTMVQCAAYRPKDYVEDPNSRSRGGPALDPPFQVVVHPDAVFVADLHSHLATCEIIGFLGGKWDEASKTLYIQAAFPCRSLVIDGDDGSTDVEMDPGSEIELRGIIEDAQLEVVGWYHSHPAFAPDPSVRDIENQTSYQQLFQRPGTNKDGSGEKTPSEPFVGLIVGTYDTRRNTPVSLFRYFHTRGEKVSGGARREIYMPYEFIPGRRHFRSVLQEEERERTRFFPLYSSVLQLYDLQLTSTQQLLPKDVKMALKQRKAIKPSPTREKAQGSVPVRKRKQSSENGGEKVPAKKAKAKSTRGSTLSVAVNHIDLTGEEETANQELVDDGSVKEAREFSTNDGLVEKVQATKSSDSTAAQPTPPQAAISNGPSTDEKNAENDLAVSDSAAVESSSMTAVGNTAEKSGVDSVDRQVAEVVADVVMSTEVMNDGVESQKRSRKGQHPKQISENYGNSGGDDQSAIASTVDCHATASPASNGSSEKVDEHEDGKASGVAPTVESADLSRTQQSVPSATNVEMTPSASSSSNRKRDRKPRKTVKNSNRSSSPASDRPAFARSPSLANPPAQTLYEAFQASGPRLLNGASHEDNVQPSNQTVDPKPANSFGEEDVHYISVDDTMVMDVTSLASQRSGDGETDKALVKDTTKNDHINQEVRVLVTSLVEKVVETVAKATVSQGELMSQEGKEGLIKQTAPVSSSTVASGCSSTIDRSTDTPVDEIVKMAVKDNALKVNLESKLRAATDPKLSNGKQPSTQLFGSNGECEDIQTSLQKMTVHIAKLKALAVTPSEATSDISANTTTETKSKLVVAKPEVTQDTLTREQKHLAALRTKYGTGMSGCTEQVITLVDYYRDFERRTDLNEIWKARTSKLEKIESSLSEYVQFLNISAALRYDFIKDLISYLRESWAASDRRR